MLRREVEGPLGEVGGRADVAGQVAEFTGQLHAGGDGLGVGEGTLGVGAAGLLHPDRQRLERLRASFFGALVRS
jgi:hypothetical protein